MNEIKRAVQAQFGSTADAYVHSSTHAAGADLARLVRLAAEVPHPRVLDVATGGGHTARALASVAELVVASDLTGPMLARARRAFADWGVTNVVLAQADAEALPFAAGSFDLVSCRIAPHHFPSPGRFVGEVARVLRAGGRFLLLDSVAPDDPTLAAYLNRLETLRDPTHQRTLSTAEWLDLCRAAGLEPEGYEFYSKRHGLADWLARAGTPPAAQAAVREMLRGAEPAAVVEFGIEYDDGEAAAYTDQKILIWAGKPA